MARTDDRIRLDFIIEGNNARQQLNSIDKEALRLRNQMKGLTKGSKEYTKTEKDLRVVTQRQKELRQQVGITGMSMRELNQESRRLRAIQQHLTPGTKQFKQTSEELRKVNARLRELRAGSRQTGTAMGNMAKSFARSIAMTAGLTMSFGAMLMGSRRAIDEFNNFEQALAGLSALTGLVGDDLEWLGRQAAEMSTQVVEGNVRITKSADDIVKAYMVMGSQRPELLKDAEALNQVTQDAIILSEAAQMELEPAIRSTAIAMNQFQLEASESRRVINAIAAGSKEGAADIPYLSSALEKAGTTANLMNISLEQTIGAIETVAPFFGQASEAGSSFDRVLLRMRAQNIGYVDGVFSLEAALEELEKRFAAGETSVDIFGQNHAKMADILVLNRGEVNRYTEAVTGTNVAIEQAAINTDTNAAKLEQAKNKTRNAMRELGEQLAPIQVASQNFFAFLAKTVAEIIQNWDTYRDILIALIAAYTVYKARVIAAMVAEQARNAVTRISNGLLIAQKAATVAATAATHLYSAAKALLTGNVRRATVAMRAFRIAMLGTPWGAILAAVTAITAALVIYARRKGEVTKAEQAHARVTEETNKQYDTQAAEILKLSSIIENGNIPLNRRKEAIDELNKIMPDYNGYLNEEGELINHNTEAIKKYLDELKEKIRMKVLEQELENLIRLQQEARRAYEETGEALREQVERLTGDASKARVILDELISQVLNGLVPGVHSTAEAAVRARRAVAEYDEAIESLTREIEEAYQESSLLEGAIEDLDDELDDHNETVEEAAKLYDILKQKISDTENAIKDINTEMRNLLFGDNAADISEMVEKLEKLEAQLQLMKVQDIMLEGIVEHGGLDEYLHHLTDGAEATQNEIDEIYNSFEKLMDTFPESEEMRDRFWDEFDARSDVNNEIIIMERERNAFLERMERERLDRIKDYSLRIADEIAGAAFQIYNNRLTNEYNQKVNQLNAERDAILANENLTREQQEQVNAQYRQREAALKQEQFRREQNAALVEAAIYTALSMIEAAPNWIDVGLAALHGAAQIAIISSQPVPQYSKGKYQVQGKDDGKNYNASWIGQPKTGLYTRPALFAETGGEIIIDPQTTRRIVTDYPQILQAIHRVKVPQYAEGTDIPDVPEERAETGLETALVYERAIEKFDRAVNKMIEEGIDANIYITELQKALSSLQDIKDSAKP